MSAASETGVNDWAIVKLLPQRTGLPMAVWITENDGYPHDVRVKVSPLHGGRASWRTAPPIAVRPHPREIVPGSLPGADVALVSRWIEVNRDVIIDYRLLGQQDRHLRGACAAAAATMIGRVAQT